MRGLMQRYFPELSRDGFVTLYKSLVRPHLEYANTVWSPTRCDIEKKSKKFEKANKIIWGLSSLRYEERLPAVQLLTLRYRQLWGI